MPFHRGVVPIRRTLKYLESGSLIFKDRVKVMTINYNEKTEVPAHKDVSYEHHKGATEFVFWNLPQVQYKNPNVQIATFKNMTPSPFVTVYLEDGSKVLFDVDSHTNNEILDRLKSTLGKTEETLAAESLAAEKKDNPANFGRTRERYCICSQPGQVPCSGLIPLPKSWRGKYYQLGYEDEEE